MGNECAYGFAGGRFVPVSSDPSSPCDPSHKTYDGPGVGAPELLQQGWIPENRIAAYHIGAPSATFTLTALSHPSGGHPLTAEIIGSNPDDIYTVEYRQKDGWDAGLPNNTVLIHRYKKGQVPSSILLKNAATYPGEWLPGSVWNDGSVSNSTVSVTVSTIDPTSGTATIVIGPPKPFFVPPKISILSPLNGSFYAVGQQVMFAATATNWAGNALPDADVTWTANANPIGADKILTTTLTAPGTYTITATANDNGDTASAHVIVNFVAEPTPPPPAIPTVHILSPTGGQTFQSSASGFSMSLIANVSAGVVKYQWADSLGLLSDTNANDTVTLIPTPQQVPSCASVSDTVELTVMDSQGHTVSAAVPITIKGECVLIN
jgi:hypothetical protein